MTTGLQPKPPQTRLVSLDALRGFDMFWIVGAAAAIQAAGAHSENKWLKAVCEQLTHVKWEGFRFVDLIFPLFMFMIGVSIPFSFAKRLARGDSRRQLYGHILLRTAILIFLGMMVNGNLLTYDVSKFQLTYSVLQMLALGYLAASIAYLNMSVRWQVALTAFLLLAYWALLAFVPGPGHKMGVFKEGCNFGDWLNDWILGDLQGRWRLGWILGVATHSSSAMLGLFAGQLVRSGQSNLRKVLWLVLLGAGCLLAGLFWSGWVASRYPGVRWFGKDWSSWPVWFPIIKNRWTSTFVLFAGGWSFLLLAFFYLVIDVWGFRRWAVPLVAIGMNSIFAYMAWNLFRGAFRTAAEVFLGGLRRHVGPWYETMVWAGAAALLWLLLYWMYRTKTFVKV